MWGLGCLLGELFKGKPLFPGVSTINQMERIIAWTGFPKEAEIRSLKAAGTGILKNIGAVKVINKAEFIPNASE